MRLLVRLLVDPHGRCDDLVGSTVVDLISFTVLPASCLDPCGYPSVDRIWEKNFVQHRLHDCPMVIPVQLKQFADVAASRGYRIINDWSLLSQPFDDLFCEIQLSPDDRSDVDLDPFVVDVGTLSCQFPANWSR